MNLLHEDLARAHSSALLADADKRRQVGRVLAAARARRRAHAAGGRWRRPRHPHPAAIMRV